jgi:mono/diheme cytochrome c family protein
MTRFIAAAVLLLAAAQARTTRDGVYSDAQAMRGERIYGMSCASCHAGDLSGSGQAPALADVDFGKEWDRQPLSDLFDRIRTTMPADAPGALTAAEVADVMAFLLSKARMPAGSTELPGDAAALKTITYAATPRGLRVGIRD